MPEPIIEPATIAAASKRDSPGLSPSAGVVPVKISLCGEGAIVGELCPGHRPRPLFQIKLSAKYAAGGIVRGRNIAPSAAHGP